MSQIKAINLTFAYDGSYDYIFDNASFSFDTNWKLGFIGRNGRGKTTFLKLLQNQYEYSGSIISDVEFSYFPYKIESPEMLTIYIIEEIYPDYQLWEIVKELSKLDLDDEVLYRPFSTLSNGEQTKILLATLFLNENKFLLIDEPTNHLDADARQIVSKYLNSKKGFILVSHDRNFLDSCIDHVISINRNDITVMNGNFSTWQHNKELQDNFEIAENNKLKKDIKHLENAVKRTSEWSDKAESRKIGFDPIKTEKNINRRPNESRKAKKMMSRSKAIAQRQQNSIEHKSQLLKNLEKSDSLKLHSLDFHSNTLLYLNEIAISYGHKLVCENISFSVNKGDRIALCGKNGCGKSSILKLIMGEDIKYSGVFSKGSGLKISYVSQQTSHLKGSLTNFAENNNIDESLFKTILFKLGFERIQFEKNIEQFSEGQRKKVLVAGSLSTSAHLYIWDEPLNFIDIISRIQIEELILKYTPTIIFVEHDAMFQQNIATKVIKF